MSYSLFVSSFFCEFLLEEIYRLWHVVCYRISSSLSLSLSSLMPNQFVQGFAYQSLNESSEELPSDSIFTYYFIFCCFSCRCCFFALFLFILLNPIGIQTGTLMHLKFPPNILSNVIPQFLFLLISPLVANSMLFLKWALSIVGRPFKRNSKLLLFIDLLLMLVLQKVILIPFFLGYFL